MLLGLVPPRRGCQLITGLRAMATSDKSRRAEAVPLDLLPVIRRSGVLPDRQFEEVRAKVLRGDYPTDSVALAERLVRESILTDYQAQRFLRNKSHGLVVGGRYVVLDRIGLGSMGRVYRAMHLLMGRTVAIKIIAPDIASNKRVVARFQREMKLVGRLDHPNVVRAFDADQVDNVLYIVMEYVPGQSLGHRLRVKGPLPAPEVVSYAAQAAAGLAHAHAQGIIHRDIKPSNLLLSEDKKVKILDLGLAVLMEADSHATFATADGIAVGTVDYMSPEQACGRELDGRTDLYSLGCAMYHLMTGVLAFPGDSPIERLGKRINGRPVPITSVLPSLPARVVETLDRLMANKPEDRFETALEASEALQALTRKRRTSAPARPANLPVPQPALAQPPAAVDSATPSSAVAIPVTAPAELPRWLRWFVALEERSPRGALASLIGGAVAIFILGLLLGWALL